MSMINQILTSMRNNQAYRMEDIANMNHIDFDYAYKVMGHLVQGGLVEKIEDNRYRKDKTFRSKQQELRLKR